MTVIDNPGSGHVCPTDGHGKAVLLLPSGYLACLRRSWSVLARNILAMRGTPRQTGRIHPLAWSRAAKQEEDFIRNHVSANLIISPITILVMAVSTAVLLLLLMLLN